MIRIVYDLTAVSNLGNCRNVKYVFDVSDGALTLNHVEIDRLMLPDEQLPLDDGALIVRNSARKAGYVVK